MMFTVEFLIADTESNEFPASNDLKGFSCV